MKTCRKWLVILMVTALLCSVLAMAAWASEDPEDPAYYQMIKKVDYQDQAANEESPGYRQEGDNIYCYHTRSTSGTGAASINPFSGTEIAMGASGEYIIQAKLKFFNASGSYSGFRVTDSGNNDKPLYFFFNLRSTAQTVTYKHEGTNTSKDLTEKITPLIGQWCILRQVFQLDSKQTWLEMYNEAGTELLYQSEKQVLPDNANLTFSTIRFDNMTSSIFVGIDDCIAAKATQKPVTVTYGEGGTVSYSGETVDSGSDVKAAYGSDAVFTVTPAAGYVIDQVAVNGEPAGTDSSVTLENVTEAQTLAVSFRQETQTPPEASPSVDPTPTPTAPPEDQELIEDGRYRVCYKFDFQDQQADQAEPGYRQEGENLYYHFGSKSSAQSYVPLSGGFSMGTEGEYLIQTKVRFTGNLTFSGLRTNYSENSADRLYFYFYVRPDQSDKGQTIFYKQEGANVSEKGTASFGFEKNVWYLVRQVYQLDDHKIRFEVYNEDGTKLLVTSGDQDLPANADLTFANFRLDGVGTDGADLDEFVIAEAVANHPAPPYAKNVSIQGAAMVGELMTASYEVTDPNQDELDDTVVQWQVSDDGVQDWTDISGASGNSFSIGAAQEGKYIRAAVTPYSKVEPKQGQTVYSAASLKISAAKPAPSVKNIVLSGDTAFGSAMNVQYTYVKAEDGDEEGATRVIWEAADSPVGAFTQIGEGNSFSISTSVAGKYLRVSITPVDLNGLEGKSCVSDTVKIPGNLCYYVAVNGNDSNPGTIDQPFATLEAARDALRQGGIPAGGATVYLRGGTYYRTDSFSLEEQDSGREGAPVVYRPYGNEKVVIHGGYDLDMAQFSQVSGTMKDLLPEQAQNKVLTADLSAMGIPQIPEYELLSDQGGMNTPMFILDGQVLHLSRYPNTRDNSQWPTMYCSPGTSGYEGTNAGNGQTDSSRAFTVQYDDVTAERVSGWTYGLDHIAAEGYWMYDWWASTRYVTINKEKKQITARENTDTYRNVAVNQNRVFCFKNVYQELDEPGEFYIDFDTQKLYIYPFDGVTNQSSLKVNQLSANLIEMDRVSYVTFSGIELTSGKGAAVNMDGGTGNVIENCYIDGFETNAVNMINGTEHILKNSHIEYCGTGGVVLSGGEKASITAGNNRVENNEINDFSLIKPVYSAGVNINGVGNFVSHNKIYNCEHYAVYFGGVENKIEYNEIYNACTNAAAKLSEAYANFRRTVNQQESTNKAAAVIPKGLSNVELNFTGGQKAYEITFEENVSPAMKICLNDIVVTLLQGTEFPNGKLIITLPETGSIPIFGDVTNLVQVGESGQSFQLPIRIELPGSVSQDVIHLGADSYEKITKQLNADKASALGQGQNYGKFNASSHTVAVWTRVGGEYAVAELFTPSADSQLKQLQINGKDYVKFKPETTSYRYALPAGTTQLPVITAEAAAERATVEIQNITEVPGTAVVTVTAEDLKTKTEYSIYFFQTASTEPSPTVQPTNQTNGSVSSTGITTTRPAVTETSPFTDITGHWAEKDIIELYNKKIVSGVTETTFEPDRSITRAEFAALIVRGLGLQSSVSAEFLDVKPGDWYASYVNAAAAAGLILGYDGYFRPEDNITREEMAVIIAKTYAFKGNQVQTGGIVTFEDAGEISSWAYESVDQAVAAGLIYGVTPTQFQPKNNATRAECTSLVKRLLEQ